MLERIDGGLFEGLFQLFHLLGHLGRHQRILLGLLGQCAQVILDLFGELGVVVFLGQQLREFLLQLGELLLLLRIELDRLVLFGLRLGVVLLLGLVLGVLLRLLLFLLVGLLLGLLDLLGQFLVVLLEFIRFRLDLLLLRNQIDQLVTEGVGLFFELFKLLVGSAVVVFDLDHVVDRLTALPLAVAHLDPVGQRVTGFQPPIGQVQRDLPTIVLQRRTECHNRLADERILVSRLHAQHDLFHPEVVKGGDEDRNGAWLSQHQRLPWPFNDHLRRVVRDGHDLGLGHRLVVAIGFVLQLHPVQPVLHQRKRSGEQPLSVILLDRLGSLGCRNQFQRFLATGRHQLDDGLLRRGHCARGTPDGLAAVEGEHHAGDRSAGQPDSCRGNLKHHALSGLGQIADAESRRGPRLALADQVLSPERPVLPALAVVPLEHDLSGLLVGRQVDLGKQHVAGSHLERFGRLGEPMRVDRGIGRIGVSILAGKRFELPCPAGRRTLGASRAEPGPRCAVCYVLLHPLQLEKLNLPLLDIAFGDDIHKHLAADRSLDISHRRRPLGLFHVLGIRQPGGNADDLRPRQHLHTETLRVSPPATDPITKLVLESLERQLGNPLIAGLLERGQRVPQQHRLALVVLRLDRQLQPLVLVKAAVIGERGQEHDVITADDRSVTLFHLVAVAYRDGVGHVASRRNVSKRVEDPRHRRGHAGDENHRQPQNADRRHRTGTLQVVDIEHLAGVESADTFERFGNQPSVEGLRNRHRPALVFEINTGHQPVVNLGQLGLDPASHQHVGKTAEQGPQHAGDHRPGRGHHQQHQCQGSQRGPFRRRRTRDDKVGHR